MTSEINPQGTQSLRDFGEILATLGQPQWGRPFGELAVSFEDAVTDEERSRLAEQGLTYFTRPHGLNDWLVVLEGMPDPEFYRIVELIGC